MNLPGGGRICCFAFLPFSPRRPLLVAGDKSLQDWIVIELVRVQAHQIGWIDVVDADDLKRFRTHAQIRALCRGIVGETRRPGC